MPVLWCVSYERMYGKEENGMKWETKWVLRIFASGRLGDVGRAPGSNIHIEFETLVTRDYLILGRQIIWRANSVTSDTVLISCCKCAIIQHVTSCCCSTARLLEMLEEKRPDCYGLLYWRNELKHWWWSCYREAQRFLFFFHIYSGNSFLFCRFMYRLGFIEIWIFVVFHDFIRDSSTI